METQQDKTIEDGGQLSRNRSFKSKQLVRSQAIRESQSPPRTVSPSTTTFEDEPTENNFAPTDCNRVSEDIEKDQENDEKKQPVEIQITGGTWDTESSEQKEHNRDWHQNSRDLLSNNPRVTCVCGNCECGLCRGRRRKHICSIKQDSGIACSDDCPDCSDSENTGSEGLRKSESQESDEHVYYCRCPERKEKPKNISLSRTDSDERSEPTGPELMYFIKETLNKNPRDRITLLKIEKELHSLVSDTGRCIVRFPVMTSYGRLLVHRCASLFQLAHHLDHNNKTAVLVSKIGTSGGRIPCTSFKQWCTTTFPPSSPQRTPDSTNAKSILKRDTNSLDEPGNGGLASTRSKSLEQREKDYERMKRRIFSTDNCSQEEAQWPWLNSGPVKLLTPETGRNKLIKVQSLESNSRGESRRGAVSKSHSFGGYGGASPSHPRVLSRQGDLASSSWRLSPSSSGYKTLSLRSTDSVTPSPTGGGSPEPNPMGGSLPPANRAGVVCAVSDMTAVPRGALLIHPQTGRPLTNEDGTLYYFDPENPPVMYYDGYQEAKIDPVNEKKRGKLEKQQSFIDHECECQPNEDARNKCCCNCRQQDSTENIPEQKQQIPTSPNKNRYETDNTTEQYRTYEATNEKPPVDRQFEPANQRQVYNSTTNEMPYDSYDRYDSQRVYEAPANQMAQFEQRPEMVNEKVNKLTNQDSQPMYIQHYPPPVRNEEITSPPVHNVTQNHSYPHLEMNMQNHVKMPHTHTIENNIRPVSATNIPFTTPAQNYQFVNHYRTSEPPLMYHTAPPIEEQKHLNTSSQQEPTFRIDPSYPYPAVDFASQCGACVDPNAQIRSFNMPYGQVEVPQTMIQPQYSVPNMVVPPQIQHYQCQEPMPWLQPKLMVPELLPVYPNLYHYGLMYPQVIPQPFPICQPMYGVVDKPPTRSSSVHSGHTNVHANVHAIVHASTDIENDLRAASTHSEQNSNRNASNEIAAKIQQIKEQMAQLNTRDKDKDRKREEWPKRNHGTGILGRHPAGVNTRVHGRQQNINDESQLSSAARAIVNSIRSMQARTHYQDNRRDYNSYRNDRPDYRRRLERDGDRLERENDFQREWDGREGRPANERDRNRPPQNHMQYRPQYFLRQMSPGTWCRRSPAPVHPVFNHPRRPHPDTKNGRR